ncbi:MAG: aminoacyl-tRNA hydrolase [Candidatus Doudnabacteria bacterium]|nr:aminoacyl-tRNA hydrolase [Candidatus Doudnabacteria bacterium]
MHLIVGLGNPGRQYEATRHNLGFRVLDLLAGSEKWETKYDSQYIKLEDVILAKPQTFMNKSGEAVKEILKYYPAAQLVVIHDDLDLPLGSIRVQKEASSAGHNGVQSIIDELGTKDFARIRLGIEDKEVLEKFTPEEENLVKEVLIKAKDAVETIMSEGLEIAQSKFNG